MSGTQPKNSGHPTSDRPMLFGLLVDVSGSMGQALRGDRLKTRIDLFKESFDRLVDRAVELSQRGIGSQIAPLIRIFAYGYGFNNPLAIFLGRDPVQDLLALPG